MVAGPAGRWTATTFPTTDGEGAVTGLLQVLAPGSEVAQVDGTTAARRLAGLAGVALALVDAGTVEELTEVVVDRGLAAVGCDAGALAVRSTEHPEVLDLTITDGFGEGPQRVYARLPLDGPLPASVAAATGRTVLLRDRAASAAWSPLMDEVMTSTGSQAFASLPLQVGGRRVGSLTAGWQDAQPFSPDQVALLEAVAAQCAQALDRLLVRDAERAAAAAVARMSEGLQRSLLTDLPEPDHLHLVARYVPAAQEAQVGGDWYDAFLVRGRTWLVVGDVSGHDRGAAVAMAQLRNLLRGTAHALDSCPADVLRALDAALQDLAVGSLATVLVAVVEQDDAQVQEGLRTLRWSNAGHLPPVLLAPDGSAELLERSSDLLLGLLPDAGPRGDHRHVLAPGSTVLLYTDGLVERRGELLDDGLERLRSAAERLGRRRAGLGELCDTVLEELGADADDDVAVLAVRAHAEDRPRPPEAGPRILPEDLVRAADRTTGARGAGARPGWRARPGRPTVGNVHEPHDLRRFVDAQGGGTYEQALGELRRGRKQGHWIWFVLPQVQGLGRSATARHYALAGLDEARAYLAHPLLGPRLVECAQALAALPGSDPTDVLGDIDALKVRSCMTLFARAADADDDAGRDADVFRSVLAQYYGGQEDPATTSRL